MTKKLVQLRLRAAHRQGYLCYYCELPMWDSEQTRVTQKFGISTAQANLLKCTAEHLESRSEGGSTSAKNIVAACRYCNQKRHARKKPPAPTDYKRYVTERMGRGRWLAGLLPALRTLSASRATPCGTSD